MHVGAHFILGLPGEDDEMLLRQVERINALPLETVKFHQLQLVRGTALAAQYDAEPGRFRLRTSEEYLSLVVEVLRRLRPDMAVERIASEVPMGFHHLTQWHLTRVSTLWSLLEKRLTARNAYQGEIFYTFAPLNLNCSKKNDSVEGKITSGRIMGVVREYFVMTIGILLYTFAWIACILPAHGTGGGATGAALVLCGAIENLFNFQINIGTMAFIVNGILLLFAGFIIGWNFGIKTIFCIIVLPASLNFFQETLPGVQAWLAELGVIPPDAISLFGNLEPLLLVIMGGMLSGVGIYMCFRQGGSTGGTDIVALLINKYHPINYGRVVLVTDSLIICASLLVGNGIETVIYGFLLTAVFGLSTDALLAGNQQSNQILVISHEHDRIAAEIVEKAHRGGDDAQRHGMGTRKESSQVVMVICRKRENGHILKIVRNLDPKASFRWLR